MLKKKRKNLIFVSCGPEKPNHPSNISVMRFHKLTSESTKNLKSPFVSETVLDRLITVSHGSWYTAWAMEAASHSIMAILGYLVLVLVF